MAQLSPVFYRSTERLCGELPGHSQVLLRSWSCALHPDKHWAALRCSVPTQGCLLHSRGRRSPGKDFLEHSAGRPGARLFGIAKDLSTNRGFCLYVGQMFQIWLLFCVRNLGLFSRNKAGFQSWFWAARGNHENSVRVQLEVSAQVAKRSPDVTNVTQNCHTPTPHYCQISPNCCLIVNCAFIIL